MLINNESIKSEESIKSDESIKSNKNKNKEWRMTMNIKMIIAKLVITVIALGTVATAYGNTAVYAANNMDIQNQAATWISKGAAEQPFTFADMWKELKPIARAMMGIGLIVLTGVGMVLGVKYVISGADDKAQVKQKLIWFIVAAVLIIFATSIFNIVAEIGSQIQS